eukprot:294232-Amorphochlora_amoeboformis.AAC.1
MPSTKENKEEKKVAKTSTPKDWISKFLEAPWSDWHPSMQVAETEKDCTYTLDVGEMKKEDLNISFKDGMITVRGFHEVTLKPKNTHYFIH